MNFTTHNQKEINSNGSSLQGVVTATYDELVSLFGLPHEADGYKVDAQWSIEFDEVKGNSLIATLYNWKDGKCYLGDDGIETKKITSWHVGGFSVAAQQKIQIILDLFRESAKEQGEEDLGRFAGAKDILDTVRSVKGDLFADTVKIALIVRKRSQLMSMLINACIDAEVMPEKVADMLVSIDCDMAAQTIQIMACHAGISREDEAGAKSIMKIVESIFDQEEKGAKDIMEKNGLGDALKKMGDK